VPPGYWRAGWYFGLVRAPLRSRLKRSLPGYFHTIGAALIAGRDFTDSDNAAHQHVAVIDDVLAQQLRPGGDALGKTERLRFFQRPYQFERDWLVVVVRDVQYHSLTAIVRPQIYLPSELAPSPNMAIVIRAGGGVAGVAAAARKQVGMVRKT